VKIPGTEPGQLRPVRAGERARAPATGVGAARRHDQAQPYPDWQAVSGQRDLPACA